MAPITPGPLVPGPLRHVELGTTTDLDEVTKFYLAWGLEVVERSDDAVALRASGTDHHVLRFVRADHIGLRHIAFAASSRQAVDELHQTWAGRGIEITNEPDVLTSLGGGYGFEAADPEGRRLRVISEMDAANHGLLARRCHVGSAILCSTPSTST